MCLGLSQSKGFGDWHYRQKQHSWHVHAAKGHSTLHSTARVCNYKTNSVQLNHPASDKHRSRVQVGVQLGTPDLEHADGCFLKL
jgi:hypothetical protein